LHKVPPGVPPNLALSLFGINGLTAYFGITEIGQVKAGETVVVSGAAGATGSVAGQIAKIKGCCVIGTAGSKEKCDWLVSDGHFDAAIDYKSEDLRARLSALCPNGIDVFFDNVGGAILNEVLARINLNARIALCGSISSYDASVSENEAPRDRLSSLLNRTRRLTRTGHATLVMKISARCVNSFSLG
jgi:NADPH-dependent curcumin reductase CurA